MLALALVMALLAGWQAYVDLGGVDSFLLPSPTEIVRSLADDRGLLWSNFTVTAEEVLLGIALAVVVAISLATAIHLSRSVRRAVYPLLIASQTVPVVIFAPLLVTWLGYDLAPKLAIVAVTCFLPVVVNAVDGLGAVPAETLKLMRTLDAGRWQTFRRVEAPTALPALFSGIRIAVIVSVIGAVFAELAGSSDGLGHLILQSIPQFQTARAYAAVVVLSVFAMALFEALNLIERRLLPWAPAPRGAIT